MFKLQVRDDSGWSTIFEGAQAFCAGYMAARGNDLVRNDLRIVRLRDGKVMDVLNASSEPNPRLAQDIPRATAFLEAGIKALGRAARGLDEPAKAQVLKVLGELKPLVAAGA